MPIFVVDSFQGSERDVIVLSGGKIFKGALKDRRRRSFVPKIIRFKQRKTYVNNGKWCAFRTFLRGIGCEHSFRNITFEDRTSRTRLGAVLDLFLHSMDNLTPPKVLSYKHVSDNCYLQDDRDDMGVEVPETDEAASLPSAHQYLQVTPAYALSTVAHERFAKVTVKQIHHLFYLGARELSAEELKAVKANAQYMFYIIRGLARFTRYHVRRFYQDHWEGCSHDFMQHPIRFLTVGETTIEQLCDASPAHTENLFTKLYAGGDFLPPGDNDWRWWTPFFYQYNLGGPRSLSRRSLGLLLPYSIAWSSTEHK